MYNSYKYISDAAVSSLLEEVETTPKPGLVDKRNSGAHRDMDYPLFVKSSNSLRDYFEECARLGATEQDQEILTAELRQAGRKAEKKMFEATGGVNTQKGLIFSMGVMCAGVASIFRENSTINDKILQSRFAQLSAKLLRCETNGNSNGQVVLAKTGVGGIRKEALSGFESCFEPGVRTLRKALSEGKNYNAAAAETLLSLMTVCEDSNVVHRGGTEALYFVQTTAKNILARNYDEEKLLEETSQFDDECIKRNISPGGAADLLALTLMIHKITAQKER